MSMMTRSSGPGTAEAAGSWAGAPAGGPGSAVKDTSPIGFGEVTAAVATGRAPSAASTRRSANAPRGATACGWGAATDCWSCSDGMLALPTPTGLRTSSGAVAELGDSGSGVTLSRRGRARSDSLMRRRISRAVRMSAERVLAEEVVLAAPSSLAARRPLPPEDMSSSPVCSPCAPFRSDWTT